jgi:3-oxoadipate enol-lactonase
VFVDVNGIKLAYSDSGFGQPVVLLVHGYPLNRSMWDPQLGSLRAAGARVIAPDLRGFGASDAGPPGALTMEQHADDLAALLAALQIHEPVVYCGLSMGGYVGLAFWRRHPERVRAFVFMDTRATADTEEGRLNRIALAERAEALGSPEPALETMLPRFFSPSMASGALPEQLATGMIRGSSARAVADGARGLAARPDSRDLLPTIDVPVLVIVGEHDALTPPADSQLLAEGIPRARLVTIDQAGHMSNLENPEAVNSALLAFLYSYETSTV